LKISSIRTLFHKQLAHLYEEREIDAIFFIYIEEKYNIKKQHFWLNPDGVRWEMRGERCEVWGDLEALAKGAPIQYITGKTTFCDLQLSVTPSVLIPRPETEELVAMVLNVAKAEKQKSRKAENTYGLTVCGSAELEPQSYGVPEVRGSLYNTKILDLCTGSGAIAIALAKKIENVEVWATDIPEDALKIAKENANANQVKVHFLQHDILNDDSSLLPDNMDIIVSNPPYIPLSERGGLHKNVIEFEPNSALFVPDENPLVFYETIAKTAKKILHEGGVLYFETHEKFHSELSALLSDTGFKEIKLWNDLNGKPRFAGCKKL